MTSQNTPTHGDFALDIAALDAAGLIAEASYDPEPAAFKTALRRYGVPYWDQVTPTPDYRTDIKAGGLLITGPVGVGKTWLAASIAADWAASHALRAIGGSYLTCRPSVAFTSSPALLRSIRDTYGKPTSEQEVIEAWTSHGLLVIDDLGKEQTSRWATVRLWEIIDVIVREPERALIVTTQHTAADLGRKIAEVDGLETAKAIVSRLSTLRTLAMTGPDRRRRSERSNRC